MYYYNCLLESEKQMTEYMAYCPGCGMEHTMESGKKIKCDNPKCGAFLTLQEQYHAGGYCVYVRYE